MTDPVFAAAWEAARHAEGWLTTEQAHALVPAAGAVSVGEPIAEVGSHRGRSTIPFVVAAVPRADLVTVDPLDDPRWGDGQGSYRGAHDHRSVLVEIDAWLPRPAPGGVISFHDTFSPPGVTLAVLERFLCWRAFAYLGGERSLIAFRRARSGSTLRRLGSAESGFLC